jgi:hypothetical protein
MMKKSKRQTFSYLRRESPLCSLRGRVKDLRCKIWANGEPLESLGVPISGVESTDPFTGKAKKRGRESSRRYNPAMKTTDYFRDQVIRKRPYLKDEWLEKAVKKPLKRETQTDGRIRTWIWIEEMGKYLRVVLLEDGETIHNAFPDRRFKE